MNRIGDKIREIEKFLAELGGIVPSSLKEYKSNLVKKAACERYVEKIVEAVVDLAFLVIKNKKFRLPQDDLNAFAILKENKIIGEVLAKKLQNAKGLRNFLAHRYGEINDKVVFQSLTEELENDVVEFIQQIKNEVLSNEKREK